MVQTFSQTFLQRQREREALDLIFRVEVDSDWEEDASEREDNTEENSDHRLAHEAGGGERQIFFFISSPSCLRKDVKFEKEKRKKKVSFRRRNGVCD